MISPHTIVVCGTEFSGSSLVAGTLRLLGIHMGEEFYPPDTHQDRLFSEASEYSPALRAGIRERNKREIWGLKCVNASYWLEDAIPEIRNPILIICSRSLGQILSKASKYSKSARVDMLNHIREQNALLEIISKYDLPVCVIDFGLAPEKLIETLCDFLWLSPDPSQIKAALEFNNPEVGYQQIGTLL